MARTPVEFKVWAVIEVVYDEGDSIDIETAPALLGTFEAFEDAVGFLRNLDPDCDAPILPDAKEVT